MTDASATETTPVAESMAKAPVQDWLVMSYETVLVDASSSEAVAVMPTRALEVAFSETESASEFESVGAVTSNSSTSVIVTEKFVSAVDPSALVALTTT